METAQEDKVTAQVPLNRLGDKFKNFMTTGEREKPVAQAPEKPPAKPAEPPKAPEAPAKPPAAVTAEPKTVVPKIEPQPEKKVEAKVEPKQDAKTDADHKKIPRENFKILEQQRDDFRAKLEAAEKRAKDIEAQLQEQSTRTPPELEDARKQLAEKDNLLKQYALEHTPEFKKAFDTRIETAIQDAKDAVDAKHMEKLEEILRAPAGKWRDARFREFAAELENEMERGDLRDAYSKLKTAQRERSDELAKASDNLKALEQMQSQRQQQAAEQSKQMRATLLKASLSEAAQGFPDFRESDNTEHNLQVAESRKMLESFLMDDLPPQEFGRMAVWAVKGIRSLNTEKALTDKIAALQSQLAEMTAANPDLAGGGPPDKTKKATTPEDAGERFNRAMREGIPG